MRVASVAVVLTIVLASPLPAAIITNSFGPATFNSNTAAMDAALGITGYRIEDFEDTTLISGLSYTLGSPSTGTFSALPNVVNGATLTGITSSMYWDQVHVLLSTPDNGLGQSGSRPDEVTFHIAGGTKSFGVGLANFQSLNTPRNQFPITDHELLINGVSHGRLEDLPGWASVFSRNLYLRVDATGGDLVNSVTFRNLDGRNIDLLIFDHVAVQAAATGGGTVPEPGSFLVWAFLGSIALGLGWRRRNRRVRGLALER